MFDASRKFEDATEGLDRGDSAHMGQLRVLIRALSLLTPPRVVGRDDVPTPEEHAAAVEIAGALAVDP